MFNRFFQEISRLQVNRVRKAATEILFPGIGPLALTGNVAEM